MKLIATAKKLTGIDFHIFSTLLMRFWTTASGAVMIVFLPLWFTQQEQGYYVNFGSLIALQVFFELGFNSIIMQFTGHEMAHLRLNTNGELEGPQEHIERLGSLVRLLLRWYLIISIIFMLSVGLAGCCFFYYNSDLSLIRWLPAWLILMFSAATSLFMSPFLSIAEGAGLVGQVAQMRLKQAIWGCLPMWLLLTLGCGLNATPIPAVISLFFSAHWLATHGRFIFKLLNIPALSNSAHISWRYEIFPYQWRLSLSWVCGYLIYQAFNPLFFAHQGPVIAGQVGITLQIFSSLQALALSWIVAKVPVMTGHIARGERKQLDQLFRSLVIRSGLFNLLCCGSAILAVYIMELLELRLATRLADLRIFACLTIASAGNHLIFSMATYMRAHRVEKILANSIVYGLLSFITIYFASKHSALLTMVLYDVVVWCVALPWVAILFVQFRRNPPPVTIASS